RPQLRRVFYHINDLTSFACPPLRYSHSWLHFGAPVTSSLIDPQWLYRFSRCTTEERQARDWSLWLTLSLHFACKFRFRCVSSYFSEIKVDLVLKQLYQLSSDGHTPQNLITHLTLYQASGCQPNPNTILPFAHACAYDPEAVCKMHADVGESVTGQLQRECTVVQRRVPWKKALIYTGGFFRYGGDLIILVLIIKGSAVDKQGPTGYSAQRTLRASNWNIILIDSTTSVFNTDAMLPYNHDLFESLIVKKRMKMDAEQAFACMAQVNDPLHQERDSRIVAPTVSCGLHGHHGVPVGLFQNSDREEPGENPNPRFHSIPHLFSLPHFTRPEQELSWFEITDSYPCSSWGVVLTSSPRMSGVRTQTRPRISNKSETRVQCFSPVWCKLIEIIAPGEEDDCSTGNDVNTDITDPASTYNC
ncbi:hypothetical protein CLF_104174, partial [Clonorchis sinensis]